MTLWSVRSRKLSNFAKVGYQSDLGTVVAVPVRYNTFLASAKSEASAVSICN
jgi:hypothetical protein